MAAPKSWEQYKEECQPIANNKGIEILGYVEPFIGCDTKMILRCRQEHEWKTCSISNFKHGNSCPICSGKKPLTWETELPILEEIAQKKGYQVLGYVGEWKGNKTKLDLLCHCGNRWQSTAIHQFKGGRGCPQCAGHNQQQLYINIVKDNDIIVALKFGIAKDSDRRLNSQNSCNMFFMERICLYDFSTVKQCKAAERAIKKKLKTGILTERELKDGYTETVSVSDLENLQKIITQYGGKLVYSKEM